MTDLLRIQADMASAMPTAGGLYFWTHYFAAEKWKNPLSFLVGYSNTIGLIGGICSIDCENHNHLPMLCLSQRPILSNTPFQMASPTCSYQ